MNKEELTKQVAKQKLIESTKRKMQTTMIGALASVEKYFGDIWGHNLEGGLTPKQEKMKEVYNQLRSEILDKGNVQIRNMEMELIDYEVTPIKYHYNLPIRKQS